MKKQDCLIIDIDGTLAYMCDREMFDYDNVINDIANENLIFILNSIKVKKIIITARTYDSRDVTEEWLRAKGVDYDEMHMKVIGDYRDDAIVKKEVYENEVKDYYNVIAVFEDNESVIKMWKEQGIFVMDCNVN